jgi:4-amino-4-deoxy-L-arabinose transferase-like glycosyltransferase
VNHAQDARATLYNATIRHGPLISLLAVLWVSCFSGLTSFALIDLVDEGFYSTISRQMVISGDWITPRVGAMVYLGKPPLFYWSQAIFIKLLGPTVLAARLPSALAVAFTSLILWWWFKRHGDELTGWLAGIFYALAPLAAGLAHIAMTDALLTLWLTIAVLGAIDGYCGRRGGYLVMGIGAGLATMTKGPLGFILPAATLFLWLLWWRRLSELRQPMIFAGVIAFLLLVLPWHIVAWRLQGDFFLREYFWIHHFQRVIGRAFGHERPFWFYLPVIVCASFPFIIFFPRAWYDQIKRLWQKQSGLEITGIFFLWTSLVFVFFSLSESKLSSYLLPVVPGVMVLAGARVSSLLREKRGLSRLELSLAVLLGAGIGFSLLACAVLGLSWRGQPAPAPYSAKLLSGTIGWQTGPLTDQRIWYRLSPFTVLAPETLVVAALVLASVVLLVVWRKSMVKVIATATALSLSAIVIFAHFAMPAWSRFDIEPMLQLAESARPSLAEGRPLVMYGIHPARTSVRYLLDQPDLVIETTDAPVLQQAVTQYRRGRILTKADTQMPDVSEPLRVEKIAGHWILWRFGT